MIIADHVAAYAAALHHCGAGPWPDVANLIAGAGLGRYRHEELAAAATAWARQNVAPTVIKQLRAHARARKARQK